ncbi:hypothetical protein [Acerihabitans sp.]|uniref:hypothetical protein n=1 Tax=Acerihabitans sp. TaxID=2811394 RepID=UPI002ED9B204
MSLYFAGLGWKHIRSFSQQNAGFFVLQFFVNPAKTAGQKLCRLYAPHQWYYAA